MQFNFDNSYEDLSNVFYQKVNPDKAVNPKAIIFNEKLISELNITDQPVLSEQQKLDLTEILSGRKLCENGSYIAQAYAGHQFGHPTMLGDGRAVLIGEHLDAQVRRFDIQLKGSGRTQFSRGGDGKASLAPMLREYLISESMHALGIPSSRSLAVVATGEQVYRETELPGAILTRVASSHLRVGTFEYAYIQNDFSILQAMLEYAVQRHFPELIDKKNLAEEFLKAVIQKQVELIVHWMRVGFIHGVMNTDNMCISGETIDYGPCAFMDSFHMDTVFSSIDRDGRYAFGQQPNIAQWNLSVLGQCLMPLISNDTQQALDITKQHVGQFLNLFEDAWLEMMSKKIGYSKASKESEGQVKSLLSWMQNNKADYTYTFYILMNEELLNFDEPYHTIYQNAEFKAWLQSWKKSLKSSETSWADALNLMKQYNPCIIPRNFKVQEALDEAQNHANYDLFFEVLNIFSQPYSDKDILKSYVAPPSLEQQNYTTYCGT